MLLITLQHYLWQNTCKHFFSFMTGSWSYSVLFRTEAVQMVDNTFHTSISYLIVTQCPLTATHNPYMLITSLETKGMVTNTMVSCIYGFKYRLHIDFIHQVHRLTPKGIVFWNCRFTFVRLMYLTARLSCFHLINYDNMVEKAIFPKVNAFTSAS